MAKRPLLFLLFLLALFGTASAQDVHTGDVTPGVPEVGPEVAYVFPEVAPEASLAGGYRFVHNSGSERADEYEYLKDSFTLGGELRVFSFPHRVNFDLDIKNVKDYFGDFSYAYKDILLFRGITRGLFHNLGTIELTDLDPTTASPGVDVRDPGQTYGTEWDMSTFFVRLKTPDFPLHLYADAGLSKRHGTEQERFFLEVGDLQDSVKVSQKRDIDWQTKSLVVGINSHLGPVEIDVSHGEKRFSVGDDQVFFDAYGPIGFPPDVTRLAGVFPHNLVPESTGRSNTIKIHTSYTGGLVGSATLSKIERENRDSDAKADYLVGGGEITWIPMPRLAFFLKYRHREIDADNPETATIVDQSDPSRSFTYQVKPALSSISDRISGTVRYRPVSGLTFRAGYSYEETDRDNAEAWNLPDSTRRNTVLLSGDARLLKGLSLKARYTHKEIDDPAYNIEPDRLDDGRVSLSWTPKAGVNAMVSYGLAEGKRDNLLFLNAEEEEIPGPDDRRVKREMFLGSVSLLIVKDLSLTASYTYLYDKTEQDTVFQSFVSEEQVVIDSSVPYHNKANCYSLGLNYLPKQGLSISAALNYTTSEGGYRPSTPELTASPSIASFSELKTRETVGFLSGDYRFKNGFGLGLRYKYSNLDDVSNNPYDDVEDGEVHIFAVTLSKRW